MSNLRNRLPPLGSLAAFEAACRLGSFTKAASELNLTQAAISRQISLLEQYLETKLFDRLQHSVAMTADGERFAAKVNPALSTIGDTAYAVKMKKKTALSIRSELCLSANWLMPRLTRFQTDHPTLSFKVMTSNLPIDTDREQFDVAVGYGTAKGGHFKSYPLATDFIVPVCTPEMRFSLPSECKIEDLARGDLIDLQEQASNLIDWRDFFAHFDCQAIKQPRLEMSTYNSVIDAALQGYGIALAWRYTVDKLLRSGQLVEVKPFALQFGPPLSAHIPLDHPKSRAVQDFVAWLEHEIEADR